MEVPYTDCPLSIDHKVARSPYKSCTEGACAFNEGDCRESLPADVSNKKGLPLRHVQQKDYFETADNRACSGSSGDTCETTCELSVVSIFMAAMSETGSSSVMFNVPLSSDIQRCETDSLYGRV